MTWIDDRLTQRKRLVARNHAVANGAEGIFNDLWDEITTLVREAAGKSIDVETNGSSFERVVITTDSPFYLKQKKRRELKISLDRPKETISARSTDMESGMTLSIDVCEDLVVCLKYDGKKILLQEAAQLILDPFLFPELRSNQGV